MIYDIYNKTRSCAAAGALEQADTFIRRLIGLMFARRGRGLIFRGAGAIHTCFMRFNLDIVFLDGRNKALRVVRGVKPFRFVICPGAAAAFETAPGILGDVVPGDELEFIPCSKK